VFAWIFYPEPSVSNHPVRKILSTQVSIPRLYTDRTVDSSERGSTTISIPKGQPVADSVGHDAHLKCTAGAPLEAAFHTLSHYPTITLSLGVAPTAKIWQSERGTLPTGAQQYGVVTQDSEVASI
jgi:hypothetical protein